MQSAQSKEAHVRALIDAALEGRLTDSQAEEISALGPEVAKLALVLAARCIAELRGKLALAGPASPSTPSGQKPPYVKPPAPKRKGKPGAKPGHVGHRRPKPARIDRREEHRLDTCPCCGGELQRCARSRKRTIEDLLENLRAEAV